MMSARLFTISATAVRAAASAPATPLHRTFACSAWSRDDSERECADQNLKMLLADLNLPHLPPVPPPGGLYRPTLRQGKLLYVSGHGPYETDGSFIVGRVGKDVDTEEGIRAARHTALAMLATVQHEVGSLNNIVRVVKSLGMVNAEPDFTDHPLVINGYSEVMQAIWGDDRGVGVRSAVGMGSLPHNITTEVETIFELAPGKKKET